MDGELVLLRARVQTSRAQGNKMVFFNLRQRIDSVQALLTVQPEKVSKQMAKWAASLSMESIVLAEGIVKKSPELIKSATVQDVELHLTQVCDCVMASFRMRAHSSCLIKLHLISGLESVLPFSVEDATRAETEIESNDEVQYKRVLLDTRLNNRVVDLRVDSS